MLFTLSTDPEFSALAEHTESRRLRLVDSWAPKSRFPLPFQNFPGAGGSAIWHDSTRNCTEVKFSRREPGENHLRSQMRGGNR